MSFRAETTAEPGAVAAAGSPATAGGQQAGEPAAAAEPGAAARRAGPQADAAVLRWTIHPAAAQPARALVVLAVIALAAALTAAVSGSAGAATLAGLLLLGSLRGWFLPRHFELDGDGAVERGPLQSSRRIAWGDVRTVCRERHGVHVSPLQQPSRWVADRGLFLRTDGDGCLAERVTAFIRRRRGA